MSSDGLATALETSASALHAAGNDMNESVAMVAAANKVVQDPSSVGAGLRTISLRLRGTDVQKMESLGEDTDGLVPTSKMRSKIQSLSGIDILTETGEYKSTYQIIKEIGNVWEDMSNMDQAALLELMAGKNRANIMAALITNMEDLEGAYESAMEADGSAMRENEAYLDSVQGKIDLFKNSLQTFWMNTTDSGLIKGVVEQATNLVQILDTVPGKIGAIVAGFSVFKKFSTHQSFADMFDGMKESASSAMGILKNIVTNSTNNLAQTVEQTLSTKISGEKIFDVLNQYEVSDDIVKQIQSIDDLGMATENLDAAQRAAASGKLQDALAAQQLSNAQFLAITSSTGLATAENLAAVGSKELALSELDAALASRTLSVSQYMATVSAYGLASGLAMVGGALKGMILAHPFIAITVATMAATAAINKFWPTAEKAAEKTDEAFDGITSAVETTKSDIQSLENEISEIGSQIDSMGGKTLSFTDKEELGRLKRQREELRAQQKVREGILESQEKVQGEKASAALSDFLNANAANSEEYKNTGKKIGIAIGAGLLLAAGTIATGGLGTIPIAMAIGGGIAGGAAGEKIGGDAAANQTKPQDDENEFEAWYRTYQDALKKKQEAAKKAQEKYQLDPESDSKLQDWRDAEQEVSDIQSEMYSKLNQAQEYVNNMQYGQSPEIDKQLDNYYNTLDKINIENDNPNAKKDSLDRVFGENASDAAKKFKKEVQKGLDSGEDIDIEAKLTESGDFNGLLATIGDLGMTAEDVSNYFLGVGEAGAGAFYDLSDAITSAEQAYTQLDKTINQDTNQGYEVRDKAIDKMKEYLDNGEIGSKSNLWNVAKDFGFEYDYTKDINANADALENLITMREKWYRTDDNGHIMEKGATTFAQDIEDAINNNKDKKGFESLKDVVWDYNDEEKTFTFDFDNQNFSDIVDSLSKTREAMGLTEDEFIDMMTALGQYYDVNFTTGNDLVSWIEALGEGGATAEEQLKSMEDPLKQLLNENGITDPDKIEKYLTGNGSLKDLPEDIQNAIKKYRELNEEIDAPNRAKETASDITSANLKRSKRDAEKSMDNLYDSGIDTSNIKIDVSDIESTEGKVKTLNDSISTLQEGKIGMDASQVEDANTIIEYCVRQKQKLEEPSIMTVDSSNLDDGYSDMIALLQQFQQAQNDLEVQKAIGVDTSDAQAKVDSLYQNILQLSNENPAITANLKLDTSSQEQVLSSIRGMDPATIPVKVKAENTDINVTAKVNDSAIDATKNKIESMPDVNTDVLVGTNELNNVDFSSRTVNVHLNVTGAGNIPKVNGTAHAQGTAHANGTAFKGGRWGAEKTETALVGELGAEMIVRGDRWFTVGDQGAQFAHIEKGDIIFNHKVLWYCLATSN